MVKKKLTDKKKKRTQADVLRDIVHLANASPAVRHIRAFKLPKDSIRLVCVCCQAIIKGNVKLASSQIEALQQYLKDLRKLASSNTKFTTRQAILKKGGLLKVLLQPRNE